MHAHKHVTQSHLYKNLYTTGKQVTEHAHTHTHTHLSISHIDVIQKFLLNKNKNMAFPLYISVIKFFVQTFLQIALTHKNINLI